MATDERSKPALRSTALSFIGVVCRNSLLDWSPQLLTSVLHTATNLDTNARVQTAAADLLTTIITEHSPRVASLLMMIDTNSAVAQTPQFASALFLAAAGTAENDAQQGARITVLRALIAWHKGSFTLNF